MKRRSLAAMTVALLLFSLPLAASAMDQGQMEGMQKGGMDHGQMEGMNKGSMEQEKMEGMQAGGMMQGMVMLGNETEDGVKAMAHIKDIHEAMAKMGMDKTHHFMVMFTNAETGKAIDQGTVAVKIQDPSGKVSEPTMLMGMPGGFGTDLVLPEKGKYEFIIGTKLADGQKRQYQFDYTYK
jgi:hypothetical protein